MTIGALVDAGVSFEELRVHLAKLNVPGYELASEKVTKQGIAGTKFHVYVHDPGTQHRRLCDIETILRSSPWRRISGIVEVFAVEAEATIHQTAIDQVHFHEVGAIDSIVDITGAVIGLDLAYNAFSPRRSMSAADSWAAHGVLPVPGPATAELLKGPQPMHGGKDGELTTPTGAALLATLAERFGPLPPLRW